MKNDENYESNTSIDCMPSQTFKLFSSIFSLTFTDVSRPTAWSPRWFRCCLLKMKRWFWQHGMLMTLLATLTLHVLVACVAMLQGTALHEAHQSIQLVAKLGAEVLRDFFWHGLTGLPQRPRGRGHLDAEGLRGFDDADDTCHAKTSCKVRLLLLRGGLSG